MWQTEGVSREDIGRGETNDVLDLVGAVGRVLDLAEDFDRIGVLGAREWDLAHDVFVEVGGGGRGGCPGIC